MVERYKVSEQMLGTDAKTSKCTYYTSVTWIIIASHPERNYRHACWHMQSGASRHILIYLGA